MAWLSGWGKRLKLTIDHNKVDENLTNFPLLVTLASGVGINEADASCVFDELTQYTSDICLNDDFGAAFSSNWIDNSNGDSSADFYNGKLRLHLNNGGYNEGCNALTKQTFSTLGLYSIEFDWWPSDGNNWYDDDLTDAKNHLQIVTANPAYNSGSWQYNDCEYATGTNSFLALELRSSKSNLVTVLSRINGTRHIILNESFIYSSYHKVKWIINFNDYTTSLYMDDNLIGTGYWDSNLLDYIGDIFKLNFHWHTYSHSGDQFYDNLIIKREYYECNNKKIMITTPNGEPCYTEIDTWDCYDKKANLWVKIPTIVSGSDTELYLYYDKTQPNNNYYVGETGSFPAHQVWDSNFKAVYHLSQSPTGGTNCIKDSTFNENHGTPQGSMTSNDLVAGKVGKALDFDGNDDLIDCGQNVHVSSALTLEMFFYPLELSSGGWDELILKWQDNPDHYEYFLGLQAKIPNFRIVPNDLADSYAKVCSGSTQLNNNAWYYLVARWDGNIMNLYLNNINDGITSDANITIGDTVAHCSIGGKYQGTKNPVKAIIDDVRVSNIARSESWIKATHYAYIDNLLSFGNEELEPKYYYHGFVKQYNQPVSRIVRLYNRETGELMDSGVSRNSDGYYYLTTTNSGLHFVVVFDDDSGEDFNALILDKLEPRGIE